LRIKSIESIKKKKLEEKKVKLLRLAAQQSPPKYIFGSSNPAPTPTPNPIRIHPGKFILPKSQGKIVFTKFD